MAKDRFSAQSAVYARYRPDYPAALYEWLIALVAERQSAWDVGTGNGQVAIVLAKHFEKVYASDISERQLQHAIASPNIVYSVGPADQAPQADGPFNLICAGQAAHWFPLNEFYAEVRRVAAPGAILALWGYGLLQINPEADRIIRHFYTQVVGPYWDAERRHIDNSYNSLLFPFERLPSPDFAIKKQYTLTDLKGYFQTWSSLQLYLKANNTDPVPTLMQQLARVLPAEDEFEVVFPVFLLAAKV